MGYIMSKYGYIVFNPPVLTKWKMKKSKTKFYTKNWIKFTKAYNIFLTLTLIIMSKVISLPEMGIILDSIYHNYSKHKIDQENTTRLAAKCNTSINVLLKVRSILAERQLLIIEGERAKQTCYWNTAKSAPNPVMLTDIYRIYTKGVKSRVKVEKKKAAPSSIESALLIFRKKGALEVTVKYACGYKKTIEVYDVTQMEVGE